MDWQEEHAFLVAMFKRVMLHRHLAALPEAYYDDLAAATLDHYYEPTFRELMEVGS